MFRTSVVDVVMLSLTRAEYKTPFRNPSLLYADLPARIARAKGNCYL